MIVIPSIATKCIPCSNDHRRTEIQQAKHKIHIHFPSHITYSPSDPQPIPLLVSCTTYIAVSHTETCAHPKISLFLKLIPITAFKPLDTLSRTILSVAWSFAP
ncbi:uncharacterized protein BCR38DRAFT_423256 [Pseudomassariella vexata]|uniref:Uncharacterized protein n=1 Tax=Pseudomassariella vexata TaxID=1141098 RepID=A0A1Y2EAL9_9PEZI|nr:uncharacterized protein BCR38DRAFT_423256 [Pseudomassariella vexata]ORY68437.1 hypothetical protein BCR38DRAFT_423256 [Pseudomassariella vexata]